MPGTDQSSAVRVRGLIHTHRVCWETYPHKLSGRHGSHTVGFELLLMGTCDPPDSPLRPGDAHSHQVYDDLKEIAEFVVPGDEPTRCEIAPFDPFVAFSTRRKFRKDIILTIEIGDREHFDGPIIEAEVRSLRQIEDRLRNLGARPGSW